MGMSTTSKNSEETVETRRVGVEAIPVVYLDLLRPLAKLAGTGSGDAAVVRYAVIELGRRVQLEQQECGRNVP